MAVWTNIYQVLKLRNFFWLIIIFFIVQGVFFSLITKPGHVTTDNGFQKITGAIPPDEDRHLGNIRYYAERPLLVAPFAVKAEPQHLWLGEIERFPSYFYYYLMSFPYRVLAGLGLSLQDISISLRLVHVLIGAFTLLVLKKILDDLTEDQYIPNLVILLTSLTGAFVWVSSAINYDIVALLLFFIIILNSIRFIKYGDPSNVLIVVATGLFLSIIKYTYLPFVALNLIIAAVLYLKNNPDVSIALVKEQLKKKYISNKIFTILILVILTSGVILFSERIVGNIVLYRSFNPSCDRVHEKADCSEFLIYDRTHSDEIQTSDSEFVRPAYQPLLHLSTWFTKYYESTYFYYGHSERKTPYPVARLLFTALVLGLFLLAILNRKKILENQVQKYAIYGALTYIIAIFIFNLKTYLTHGAYYAHQGRYILPGLVFIYLLVILMLVNNGDRMGNKIILTLRNGLILIAALFFIIHVPSVSFFWNADNNNWYSDIGLRILPDYITNRQ